MADLFGVVCCCCCRFCVFWGVYFLRGGVAKHSFIHSFIHCLQETEKFVDSLLESDWQPYCGRPRNDLVGYFVIFQWRNKERLWVPLLADDGKIANRLNKIFSVKNNEPISKYLTSFPKVHRNLIWIKWQETALGRDVSTLCDLHGQGRPL